MENTNILFLNFWKDKNVKKNTFLGFLGLSGLWATYCFVRPQPINGPKRSVEPNRVESPRVLAEPDGVFLSPCAHHDAISSASFRLR